MMEAETEQAGEHQGTAPSQLASPASQPRDECCERKSLRESKRAKRVKTLEGPHPRTGEGEG